MDILILGGDNRSLYTARALSHLGRVQVYGTGENDPAPSCRADCLILGLPATKDGESVYAPRFDGRIPLAAVPEYAKKGGLVLGGMLTPVIRRICADSGLFCEDYYNDEALMLKNAVPSAEGALAAGINATDSTLMGMKTLVTGYGRIGALLAKYLVALGADVTVACRSRTARVLAQTAGCNAVDFGELSTVIGGFSLIYNTVPACVISMKEVSLISRKTVYIELASSPGIDTAAAYSHGIRILSEQGLPSRTAPATAGRIIAEAAEDIISGYSHLYGKE